MIFEPPPKYVKELINLNQNNDNIQRNNENNDNNENNENNDIISVIIISGNNIRNEHPPPYYNNNSLNEHIIPQNDNTENNIIRDYNIRNNIIRNPNIINNVQETNIMMMDSSKNEVYFLNNIIKSLNLIFISNNIFYIIYFKNYYILLSILVSLFINYLLTKYNPLSIIILVIMTIIDFSIKIGLIAYYNNIYLYVAFSSIILNFYILYSSYRWVIYRNKLSSESINDLVYGYKP